MKTSVLIFNKTTRTSLQIFKKNEFDTIYKKELTAIGLSKKALDSIRPFMIDFLPKITVQQIFIETLL